jgi:hypothetical protein
MANAELGLHLTLCLAKVRSPHLKAFARLAFTVTPDDPAKEPLRSDFFVLHSPYLKSESTASLSQNPPIVVFGFAINSLI